MRVRFSLFVVVMILFSGTLAARAEGALKFARLNDFRLESGEVIQDCRLAYRTFGDLNYDADNWVRQVKAVMSYDIYKLFGGSPELTAKTVKTSLFVVDSDEDRMVSPGPAAAFAAIPKAKTFRLSGECGHLAFLCEKDSLAEAVNRFLR